MSIIKKADEIKQLRTYLNDPMIVLVWMLEGKEFHTLMVLGKNDSHTDWSGAWWIGMSEHFLDDRTA